MLSRAVPRAWTLRQKAQGRLLALLLVGDVVQPSPTRVWQLSVDRGRSMLTGQGKNVYSGMGVDGMGQLHSGRCAIGLLPL